MKRIILVGLITIGLIAALAIPVLAQGFADKEPITPENNDVWETMYQACGNGDWEAMADAAETVHREAFSYMPCYGIDASSPETEYESSASMWGNTESHMGNNYMGGSHMDGGMMGGDWNRMIRL